MKGELVIGAIAGDILGSPYERNAIYNPDVDLTDEQDFTDDSILTIATMECMLDDSEEFEKYYMKWGRKFIGESIWGKNFFKWLHEGDCKVINHSWGNGCLMRISPIAYFPGTEEDCKRLAILSCQYTHNCPESFLAAIEYVGYLYRLLHHIPVQGMINNYEFYLNNPTGFDCSVKSVKQAYSSYIHGGSIGGDVVLNCIKSAIRLGGDTDTIGAMTGALAETGFSVQNLTYLLGYLTSDMIRIVREFSKKFNSMK